MPVDYWMKATNELAVLEFDVTNEDGSEVDLTGATADYRIWSTAPGTDTLLPITPTLTIPVPDTTNRVRVAWIDATAELATAGRYYGRCDIEFASGHHLTVPTLGYHSLFVDALGPTSS